MLRYEYYFFQVEAILVIHDAKLFQSIKYSVIKKKLQFYLYLLV